MKQYLRLTLAYGVVAVAICQTSIQSADLRAVVEAYVAGHQRALVAELVELLTIPNVSGDEENIRRNAVHLRGMLQKRGFNVDLLETGGNPLVYGELKVPQAKRTLLIWAHYDGQPVDPKGWKQPNPFVPVLRDGRLEDGARVVPNIRQIEQFNPEWRLYARSASDDKGPIVALCAALDALKTAGLTPSSNLRVILDGEEESGSPSLIPALAQYRDRFSADLMLIFDGPLHSSGRPTVAFGVRGALGLELTVYGPKVGVHSGHYGNWVPNPALRLAHLLASMKDDEGKVLVKGFYDGLAPLTREEQEMLDSVPDDPASLMKLLGIAAPEREDLSLQQALQLPALNVRGFSSAFVGPDARTTIPDRAIAALDIRLVKETPASATAEKIRSHVRAQGYHVVESEPDDATRARYGRIVKVVIRGGVNGYRTSPLTPESMLVIRAVAEMLGQQPVQIRTMGGTVPIARFVEALGFPAILLPTVNFDNNQHAENENLRLGHFFTAVSSIAAVLTM
jgi:acetylornithine deacetylase/succinyl-diaminopimelate desuccinylase-like protein